MEIIIIIKEFDTISPILVNPIASKLDCVSSPWNDDATGTKEGFGIDSVKLSEFKILVQYCSRQRMDGWMDGMSRQRDRK